MIITPQIGSEKPDLLLPDYRRYETLEPSASDRAGSTQVQLHNPARQEVSGNPARQAVSRKSGKDRAAKLDWSANIASPEPQPLYEVGNSELLNINSLLQGGPEKTDHYESLIIIIFTIYVRFSHALTHYLHDYCVFFI